MRLNVDYTIAGCALAFGGFILWSIPNQVPGATLAAVSDMSSSAFFPILTGVFMILCGVALAVRTASGKLLAEPREQETFSPRHSARMVAVLLLLVAYLITLKIIGMIVSSMLLIAIMAPLLGYRNVRYIVASAAIFPVVIYLLFDRLLHILLPNGVFF